MSVSMRVTRSQSDFEKVIARDPLKRGKIILSYRIKDLEDLFLLRITQYTIDLREFKEIKRKLWVDHVKVDKIDQIFALIPRQRRHLTDQDRVVDNFTWSRVKNNSKLTNLMKISRIEGYNGK